MDNLKPAEVISELVHLGAHKAALPAKDILIRGFLSGAFLSFATVLAFTTAIQTHLDVLGALVFPVGFAIIILLGLELVTGNFAVIPMAVMAGETTKSRLAHNWSFAIFGNLVGSLFFGVMFAIYITKAGHSYQGELINKVIAVAESKTLDYKEMGYIAFLVIFVKAVLCNWMVALGVVMGNVSTSTVGKMLSLWLPVFTFFALGLEHCIVNMFVIPTAILLKANITFADWWVWNQIPVILGNLVGGFFFTGVLLFVTFHKKGQL